MAIRIDRNFIRCGCPLYELAVGGRPGLRPGLPRVLDRTLLRVDAVKFRVAGAGVVDGIDLAIANQRGGIHRPGRHGAAELVGVSHGVGVAHRRGEFNRADAAGAADAGDG